MTAPDPGKHGKALVFIAGVTVAALVEIARREIDYRLLHARTWAWNRGFVAGQKYVEQNVGTPVDYKFAEPENPHDLCARTWSVR